MRGIREYDELYPDWHNPVERAFEDLPDLQTLEDFQQLRKEIAQVGKALQVRQTGLERKCSHDGAEH